MKKMKMSLRGSFATAAIFCLFLFAACGGDDIASSSVTPGSDPESSCSVKVVSSSVKDKFSSSVISGTVPKSSSGKVPASAESGRSKPVEGSSSSTNEAIGSVLDSRDMQSYRTVKIGSQTWMAENLNYKTENSFCYNDDISYCRTYGRLYTWAAAMDSAGEWSTNSKGCGYGSNCSPTGTIRGVCPEGWHLPSEKEWNTLITTVGAGGKHFTEYNASEVLKSKTGWRWNRLYSESGNGSDAYSFTVLPAGRKQENGYDSEGSYTFFWNSSISASDSTFARSMEFGYDNMSGLGVYVSTGSRGDAFSVRCIQDDEPEQTAKSSSSVNTSLLAEFVHRHP